MTTCVDLNIGDKYRIILYPSENIFRGDYLGNDGKAHIFRGSSEKIQGCAIVSNHWMETLPDGTITYPPICSSPMLFVPEDKLAVLRKSMPGLLRFLNSGLEESK